MRAVDYYMIGLMVFSLGLIYITWAFLTNEIFRIIVGIFHILLAIYIFYCGTRK